MADLETTIGLRVQTADQLFHTLDPSPSREREINAQAESFIVDWARETPPDGRLTISVYLPANEADSEQAHDIPYALRSNFEYRASQAKRELNELFREGRQSLLVGVPILATSLIASQLIQQYALRSTIGSLIGESLLILGWVANWRPLEIFLYAWWPIRRRMALYRRLAAARFEVHGV